MHWINHVGHRRLEHSGNSDILVVTCEHSPTASGRKLTLKNTDLIASERPLSAQSASTPPSLHPINLPLQERLLDEAHQVIVGWPACVYEITEVGHALSVGQGQILFTALP